MQRVSASLPTILTPKRRPARPQWECGLDRGLGWSVAADQWGSGRLPQRQPPIGGPPSGQSSWQAVAACLTAGASMSIDLWDHEDRAAWRARHRALHAGAVQVAGRSLRRIREVREPVRTYAGRGHELRSRVDRRSSLAGAMRPGCALAGGTRCGRAVLAWHAGRARPTLRRDDRW
jgi:hypothetical protein